MIKGIVFRGIGYKCAMMHYNNAEWQRAIKEFETIASESDPHIYEMMSKCYLKMSQTENYIKHMNMAIDSYTANAQPEKAEQLKAKLSPNG